MEIGNEDVFTAGTALAGGVARCGETCGALTGVLMAVGLVAGRRKIEDVQAYQSCMKLGYEVMEKFRQRIGHSICAEIQKLMYGRSFRMYDDAERKMFHDAGGHSRNGCPGVCGKAARLAAEIILRERSRSA